MLAMTRENRGPSAAAAYYSALLVRASPSIPARGREHRDLLGGHGTVAHRRPCARGRGCPLLRDHRPDVGVHARVPGPQPRPLAFQVPNLVRSLFADSALSAAFVPVFTELLEHDKRKDALHLASALFGLILVVLSVITVIFIALAGVIMPIFTGPEFSPALDALTVGLSRVLFRIVILLGVNGLLVGVLNANDHFTIPAISPLVWNIVIVVAMVALTPLFEGP